MCVFKILFTYCCLIVMILSDVCSLSDFIIVTFSRSTPRPTRQFQEYSNNQIWEPSRVSKQSRTTQKPNVVGGRANSNFPYMVSIRKFGLHHCGASIINDQWLLTAAHCLYNASMSDFHFMVGSSKLNQGGTLYKPSKIILHNDFKPETTDTDIALIKLTQPIKFGQKVKKINLNTDVWREFSQGLVTGWGFTYPNSTGAPNDMQFLVEDIISNDECQRAHSPIPIYVSYICGRAAGSAGLCGGDSGSPLVYNGYQIGIASWIRNPCGKNPDVYVNVAHYAGWINYTVSYN